MKKSKNCIRKYFIERIFKSGEIGLIGKLRVSSVREQDSEAFIGILKESLGLIEMLDGALYTRIQNILNWIFRSYSIRGRHSGTYLISNRAIIIDFDPEIDALSREWQIIHYASIIIYYATYGYIIERGVKISDKNCNRVALACMLKVNKFLRKFHDRSETHVEYQFWNLDKKYVEFFLI